jgi:mxaD protein
MVNSVFMILKLGFIMKKIPFIISALFLVLTTTVNAHGPVRQKAEQDITINAPADKVWGIIKDFGDMSWHPGIKNITNSKANEKGSVRVLTLKSGGTITEELKKYDEKNMSYAYKITEMSTLKTITHAGAEEHVPVLPVDNYAASIDVTAEGNSSVVAWKAGYYRAYTNNNPPDEMNEEAANTAVNEVLKTGLENLKALAEK